MSADMPAGREMAWEVNGLTLAGLAWGNESDKPLLALHGWLDNAASFARLGPLLEGYHVVAPDLTGQGRSDHRSPDASYQIWDDLPELLGIVDSLGWKQFDLLGHSRGAIISTLLASAFPERVKSLVMLDAVSPEPVPQEQFPAQMRKALEEKKVLLGRPNRVYASEDDAVATRSRYGLTEDAARLLSARSLKPCEGGVTWTTDARLHGASAVKLTDMQIRAVLAELGMPAMLLLAGDNPRQSPDAGDYARDRIDRLRIERISGGHHFHMEVAAVEVAACIADFLQGGDAR